MVNLFVNLKNRKHLQISTNISDFKGKQTYSKLGSKQNIVDDGKIIRMTDFSLKRGDKQVFSTTVCNALSLISEKLSFNEHFIMNRNLKESVISWKKAK